MRRFITALLISLALVASTGTARATGARFDASASLNLKPSADLRVDFADTSLRDELVLLTDGLPDLADGELRELEPPAYDD